MQILIQRRAEIALRSLQKPVQKQIAHALDELSAADRKLLHKNPKLYSLVQAGSGKKLFVYRGSPKLRLILSLDHDTCTIEDIVDHDRLARLRVNGGRE